MTTAPTLSLVALSVGTRGACEHMAQSEADAMAASSSSYSSNAASSLLARYELSWSALATGNAERVRATEPHKVRVARW